MIDRATESARRAPAGPAPARRPARTQRACDVAARFATYYEAIGCGVLVHDPAGCIVYANTAAERILGLSGDKLRGWSPLDAGWTVEGEDGAPLPPERYPIAMALQTRLPQRQVTLCLRPPGRDRDGVWLQMDAVPVLDRDGAALYVVTSFVDVTQLKEQAEALQHQALHDALTGLPNRSLLLDRLRQAILSARRSGQRDTAAAPLAFLLMDLDRFKDVNDTLGHHYGDLLLQQIGPRLQTVLRAADTIARLGGDEFAMVLPGADAAGAAQAARKVLLAMDEPFVLKGQSFEVGASIGIALYPAQGKEAETLMRHADVAMYVAKRARSGYAVYATEQDQHASARLALPGELRQAVRYNQLLAHYQPKVNCRSRSVTSVEALVRWQHPSHGLILPDQFMGAADTTGSIKQPGLWMLETALQQCRAWHDAGLPLGVSVNLSMRNLHDPELPESITAALERYGVAPEWLKVEIAEGAVMADPAHTLETVARLHAMDVRIAIDDFGTGYAPMAYLKRLAVDELKIDRSFVRGLMVHDSDAAIVRSTIKLGHSLGLKVVAVGVESAEAWERLVALDCDAAQGFFLSHPLPADDLERWLRASPWLVGAGTT